MYRFRFSTRQNKEESKPEKSIQNQTNIEAINKYSNNPPKNIGYHNFKDLRQSGKTQMSTNNNPINQIENVSKKEKNEDTKKFVKYSRYQSNKSSLQPQSETSKKPPELSKNENEEKSQQIPQGYKRRSYLITPKEKKLNENLKDNNKDSSNEIKKEYEIIKDKKKGENNMTRRYIRRFNKDKNIDKTEYRNQEKKDDETDTTNSNINTSNKNITSFTKGRLLNDSNDKIINIENEKPPSKSKEIKEKDKDKEEIELKKEINEPNKGFKMRRFGKGIKQMIICLKSQLVLVGIEAILM